jgi:hypothetical protein
MEWPAIVGDSPVTESEIPRCQDTRVPQDTCNPAGIWEDHLPRLSTTDRPIVN